MVELWVYFEINFKGNDSTYVKNAYRLSSINFEMNFQSKLKTTTNNNNNNNNKQAKKPKNKKLWFFCESGSIIIPGSACFSSESNAYAF